MTTGQKSLIVPPKNLKEAIDWVLRVSGKDSSNDDSAIKGLTGELIKLLDKDAGEVARGVLEVMGKSFDKVVKGLKDFQDKNAISTFVLRGLIEKVSKSLQKVTDYGSAAGPAFIKEVRGLLQKEVINPGEGPIGKLADGFKMFIGWQNNTVGQDGIGKPGGYQSKYDRNEAKWPSKPDEQKTCALIFLGLLPLIFYFLPYLYAKCNEKGDWNSKGLANGEVKEFMESDAVGYTGNLGIKQGSDVANILKSSFGELNREYESAKKTIPRVRIKMSLTATSSTTMSAGPGYCPPAIQSLHS
ncbi:variant erythrocyte surface antigen-1 family protein [Babesia caballi]|uniref:Variant erythrocyte surface antigen-1 family protein n=1 Tax=Babesia caballi TaxID=5871 RepID=A0AAV4M0L8_BABCB|nr:variant erythrocyte surface antigen-1 family protein [Babesia caballi]